MGQLSDEQKAWVLDQYNLGQSSGQIARQLKCSRNVIVGFVSRNKKNGAVKLDRPARNGATRSFNAMARKPCPPEEKEKRIAARAKANDFVPDPAMALRFDEFVTRRCKWPIGDPSPNMMVCGHDVKEGSPYCPDHAWRGVQHGENKRL